MLNSANIKIMQEAAYKAGKGLARDFNELENLQVSRKGTHDFVTSADLRAEKRIIETLQKSRPDWGFLTEETGEIPGKDGSHRWIVDPLDGTNNFMHGLPHFCISIALEKRNNNKSEIIAGVIFSPILVELYVVEKGKGGFVEFGARTRKLHVSGRDKLEESVVGSYILRGKLEESKQNVEAAAATSANVRIMGSAALEMAYVAAGKMDAFWHHNLKPWDMAAGGLMVQEAKGVVQQLDGEPFDIYANNVLATNQGLHGTLSDLLKKHYA